MDSRRTRTSHIDAAAGGVNGNALRYRPASAAARRNTRTWTLEADTDSGAPFVDTFKAPSLRAAKDHVENILLANGTWVEGEHYGIWTTEEHAADAIPWHTLEIVGEPVYAAADDDDAEDALVISVAIRETPHGR